MLFSFPDYKGPDQASKDSHLISPSQGPIGTDGKIQALTGYESSALLWDELNHNLGP